MKKTRLLVLTMAFVLLMTVSAGAMLLDYEAEFGDIDFEGETVTYIAWYDPFEEFVEGGDYAGRLEEAKEKFNIGEIEYLNVAWGEDLQEVMMSRLLGGESGYDVWMLYNEHIWPMIVQGAFYPMNEILPQEYYDNLSPDLESLTETFSYQGERYALGVGEDHYFNLHYLAWNKDLFEREGLTPLDELYREDNLTWDEVESIAAAATRDTSGDGEIDQWGLGHFEPFIWASSNNALPAQLNEQGQMQFTFDSEEALYALETLTDWDQSGYFGASWEREEFRDGYIAMELMALWQFEDTHQELEDEWGAVPLPRGPHADDHVYFAGNVDNFYVPSNSEHPEGIAALHNFLFRQEEWLADREEARLDNAPDQVAYDAMVEAEQLWDGEAHILVGLIGPEWDDEMPLGAVMGPIMYEGADPATEMAAGRAAIQAEIDDLFDQ